MLGVATIAFFLFQGLASSSVLALRKYHGAPPTILNITAIAANSGRSTLECWEISTPFKQMPGQSRIASITLGELDSSSSFAYGAPDFDLGLHNAPALQYYIYDPPAGTV